VYSARPDATTTQTTKYLLVNVAASASLDAICPAIGVSGK
jgi:hypothetical protein